MNRMTRLMYSGRGLHGNHTASERRLRGWALMVNFAPDAHRSNVQRAHRCPAHQLSNKCYSENWLENLLVSASMNGNQGLESVRVRKLLMKSIEDLSSMAIELQAKLRERLGPNLQ